MVPDASIALAAVVFRAFIAGGRTTNTASGATGHQGDLCTLPQQLHLELPQSGEDVQNQPPGRAGGINVLVQRPQTDPTLLQLLHSERRAGLDPNPVDLSVPGEVNWLEALIWPEQTDRLARLRAAIKIVSEQKPRLVKGDLRTDLAALAREAPKDATLVIFHTAVLAYVSSAAKREEFARSVGSLCDFWIANEMPQVFPNIARRAGSEGRGAASC